MTTGAPPPSYFFNSSANIAPHMTVQPRLYNDGGFVPHPLTRAGASGWTAGSGGMVPADAPSGVAIHDARAGATDTKPGGFSWLAGHPHTINGEQPQGPSGSSYSSG